MGKITSAFMVVDGPRPVVLAARRKTGTPGKVAMMIAPATGDHPHKVQRRQLASASAIRNRYAPPIRGRVSMARTKARIFAMNIRNVEIAIFGVFADGSCHFGCECRSKHRAERSHR